jgi:hypothetical protein
MGEAKQGTGRGWNFPKTDRTISSTVEVGRYRAHMTFGLNGSFTCEWSPKKPADITTPEVAEYRRGRNELVSRAVAELGVKVVVVEQSGLDELAAKNDLLQAPV